MNDNDIIKSLGCCKNKKCVICPYDDIADTFDGCSTELIKDALCLINRLKAENERLQHLRAEVSKENEELTKRIDDLKKTIDEKANVVKCRNCCHWAVCRDTRYGICGYLEDLCGELVHVTGEDFCSHGEREVNTDEKMDH